MRTLFRADDVRPEWLTAVLKAAGAVDRARVAAVRMRPVNDGKGVTGQITRMHIAYDRAEAGAPQSLIAKCSAAEPQARALFHSMGFYEREAHFYQRIAHLAPLRTPRCYYSAVDSTSGDSLLILEDLGSTGSGSLVEGCSAAEAERGVRAISALHAAWWQHPRTTVTAWLERGSFLSADRAPATFRRTWQPFLDKLAPPMREDAERVGAWLNVHIADLHRHLYRDGPYTLIHNDLSPENLFFVRHGEASAAAVLDWQVSTFGHGVTDIAVLLGDLTAADRPAEGWRLLRLYHSFLVTQGVREYSFERCCADYRLAMLHVIWRISTAVGNGGMPPRRERQFCDIISGRYFAALRDAESYTGLS